MTATAASFPWWEGIVVVPGPTDGTGTGSHQVDMSGALAPQFAVIGVVGFLAIVVVAFVLAARRRLRPRRR